VVGEETRAAAERTMGDVGGRGASGGITFLAGITVTGVGVAEVRGPAGGTIQGDDGTTAGRASAAAVGAGLRIKTLGEAAQKGGVEATVVVEGEVVEVAGEQG